MSLRTAIFEKLAIFFCFISIALAIWMFTVRDYLAFTLNLLCLAYCILAVARARYYKKIEKMAIILEEAEKLPKDSKEGE